MEIQESSGSRSRDVGGMNLVWEDLTVLLPNFSNGPTKRLLNGLTGYAQPGRLLAIMGPSGSGKSTLLDALAGRLAVNTIMSGNILLNGRKRKLDYGLIAYVTQDNTILGTLTVRETISYSAQLRLPSTMTKKEIDDIVEGTITDMGLHECADTLVGNWHLRGISGGEKKRLYISLEILTKPSILFLDEPTSGLDSASAFFVTQTLQNIARDGKTVISSIHQPSSEVFDSFDDLYLLSGGQTVYFGVAKDALEFFADLGFPCPSRRNPSDHFLRCINSDFDVVTANLIGSKRLHVATNVTDPSRDIPAGEIKAILVEKYRYSKYAHGIRATIRELSSINEKGIVKETRSGSQATWCRQLSTLTRRSLVNMCRDVGYYWVRISIYIALALCVGSIFYDLGKGYSDVMARGSCGAFISGFMTFMSIGGFPSFIEEMKVFQLERRNGYYGVTVYILSNFFSSFPFVVGMSLLTASITYLMVKFHPGFSHFAFISLDLICNIAIVESCMMIIASLVPNFLMGIIVASGYIGTMMMTSGFFRLAQDLPKVFWRYPMSYLNYGAWGLQGAFKNDLIGLKFDPQEPGGPNLTGEEVLTKFLGIQLNYSKWWDLAAVIVILIYYRLLFFIILKFRERAFPLFRSVYTKRTLQHLSKRPSFRKIPSFPSKRHLQLHSLSSQEGLNSPIY